SHKILRSCGDAVVCRVNVESAVSYETEQGHARCISQLNGQTRWRSYRRKNWNACLYGFLHQLETRAAAHEENSFLHRDSVFKPLGAHDFVHRVVPSNVLPH